MAGYINRDNVLAKKRTLMDIRYGTGSRTIVDVPAVLVSDIEDIPDEDVRPAEWGTWIYYVDEITGMTRCKCSNCKTSYGCMDTPFCPNCGADMGL